MVGNGAACYGIKPSGIHVALELLIPDFEIECGKPLPKTSQLRCWQVSYCFFNFLYVSHTLTRIGC